MKKHIFRMMLFVRVPDLVSGTRTKIPAGHERLASHGWYGGRGTPE